MIAPLNAEGADAAELLAYSRSPPLNQYSRTILNAEGAEGRRVVRVLSVSSTESLFPHDIERRGRSGRRVFRWALSVASAFGIDACDQVSAARVCSTGVARLVAATRQGSTHMRVAALYDIHGNLPALEAVLRELRAEPVDRVVVGGDVFPGPMCRETLVRLRALETPVDFIRGNCETALLSERAGREVALPEQVRQTMRWCAAQLAGDEERFVGNWPLTITLDVDGIGAVLFCHGTPRDDNEIFTVATPDARLAPAFAHVTAPVVVCGHTHMQFDRKVGEHRVINAGSVGMPFGEPGAYWLRIGPGVELRRTSYDLAAAAERIRAASYPQAEEFASKYVLAPPAAKEMLELYTRYESK